MSDDAPSPGDQGQSQTINAGPGEQPEAGTSVNAVQTGTIKVLDEVIANFMAQCTSMHDACQLIAAALEENPSLTPEQRTETYNIYGEHLEEAYGARM